MTQADTRFGEIYEKFFRHVYGYCTRRTSADRVDDAVAEVFLLAWKKIDQVPSGDEALPWLYAVAFRVLGNQWRSQSRRSKLASRLNEVGITPMTSAEDFVVASEETQLVLEAVSRLKRTDQEILKLSMWEEISHSDISYILDITPGAVKQRLYEARKNLTREYNRLEKRRTKSPAAQKGGGQ